jgi:hypothetical protein
VINGGYYFPSPQRQLKFPIFTTNFDTATGRQAAFACLWAKLFPACLFADCKQFVAYFFSYL